MFSFDEHDDFFINPRPQTIGNMGEDIIIKDLIRRRFYVYIPVIHRSPCDMIIMKGGQTLRVEVKTGTVNPGRPQKENRLRYDVLVKVILQNRKIRYRPAPDSLIQENDPLIDRCLYCGKEAAKTTDLSGVPCYCPGDVAARFEEMKS